MKACCFLITYFFFYNVAAHAESLESSRELIVKGQDTKQAHLAKIQYFASLVRGDDNEKQLEKFCGSSIISDRYIMTAAHCLDSIYYNHKGIYVSLSLRNGHHINKKPKNLKKAEESEYLIPLEGRRIYMHPNYRSFLEENSRVPRKYDLALIQLQDRDIAKIKALGIQPLRLGSLQDVVDQSNLLCYGRGMIHAEIDNTEVSDNIVKELHTTAIADEHPSIVVTYSRVESVVNKGDSDGPLVYQSTSANPILIGVASYITLNKKYDAVLCSADAPFYYGYISGMKAFIDSKMDIKCEI